MQEKPDIIAYCWYCRKDRRLTYVEHRDAYGCLTCEKMFYGTDSIRDPSKYKLPDQNRLYLGITLQLVVEYHSDDYIGERTPDVLSLIL